MTPIKVLANILNVPENRVGNIDLSANAESVQFRGWNEVFYVHTTQLRTVRFNLLIDRLEDYQRFCVHQHFGSLRIHSFTLEAEGTTFTAYVSAYLLEGKESAELVKAFS